MSEITLYISPYAAALLRIHRQALEQGWNWRKIKRHARKAAEALAP